MGWTTASCASNRCFSVSIILAKAIFSRVDRPSRGLLPWHSVLLRLQKRISPTSSNSMWIFFHFVYTDTHFCQTTFPLTDPLLSPRGNTRCIGRQSNWKNVYSHCRVCSFFRWGVEHTTHWFVYVIILHGVGILDFCLMLSNSPSISVIGGLSIPCEIVFTCMLMDHSW